MGNCQSQESLTMVLNRNRLNQINNVLIPEIRQNIIQLQQLPQLETALSLEYENTRLIIYQIEVNRLTNIIRNDKYSSSSETISSES